MRKIDADALQEKWCTEMCRKMPGCEEDCAYWSYIHSAPTIEERKGKWFDTANVYDKRANKHDYFCLECKTNAMDFICGSEDWWCGKAPKYCPNCGAKMEGAENER